MSYSLLAETVPVAPLFIPIGQAGNLADGNGFGAVAYPYQISNQRITYREYAQFLNSVDPGAANERRLYDERMGSKGGIALDLERPEGERYQLREGKEDASVRYVDWFDAARYVNWLSNGALAGGETETGSYDLAASPTKPSSRKANARYWIPSTQEWYKAAFFVEDVEKPRYRSRPRWPDAIRNGAVMEIVDTPLEADAYMPAARSRLPSVHFIFIDATSPRAVDETWGFRLCAMADELEPVAELEPVGEESGFGPIGPGFGFPGWGGPQPINPAPDPERPPSS